MAVVRRLVPCRCVPRARCGNRDESRGPGEELGPRRTVHPQARHARRVIPVQRDVLLELPSLRPSRHQPGYGVAAYGVPQTRKRVLIIGNNLGLDFEFPQETHSFDSGKSKKHSGRPFAPTLNEAIAGLGVASSSRKEPVRYLSPEPANKYDAAMRKGNLSGAVNDHFHSTTEDDCQRYSLLAPGHTMKDLVARKL